MRLAFTEKNNQLVWTEALEQSRALINSWTQGHDESGIIGKAGDDTMRLSLGVISRAALGWKMQPTDRDAQQVHQKDQKISFTDALRFILRNVILIIAVPKWLLKMFPSYKLRVCYTAYTSFGHYMRTLIAERQTSPESDKPTTTPSPSSSSKPSSDILTLLTHDPTLSSSDLLGNLFVLLLAGHETTAHSLHACLFLLALHPSTQRLAQADLDRVLPTQSPSSSPWPYTPTAPRLFQSTLLPAILSEQLRLLPSIINIPKVTKAPQPLIIEGDKQVTVPMGTMVRLCVPAVHRNPRFWPHEERDRGSESAWPPGNRGNDLEEFNVKRWLVNSDREEYTEKEEEEDHEGESEEEGEEEEAGASHLLRPPKGAYIPFSAGARACPGKRFATIEVLAVLAVILQEYSVELAGPEDDEQVQGMEKDERERLWRKRKEEGMRIWQGGMSMGITLGMKGRSVPIRIVRRGRERFVGLDG
ncbi:MAG: hypothetical protein Q9227_001389 [Pyrenula ochraceoflavens]